MRNIKTLCAAALIAGSAITMTACSSDNVAQTAQSDGSTTISTSTSSAKKELPDEVTWYFLTRYGSGVPDMDAAISPDGLYKEDHSEMKSIDDSDEFKIGEPIENVVFYSTWHQEAYDGCTVTPEATEMPEYPEDGNLQFNYKCDRSFEIDGQGRRH